MSDRILGAMEKDFDRWNILKKRTDETNSLVKIKEGEIRWCKFGLNIGNEVFGKGDTFHRPVLILKKFSGDVFLGLPLITQEHKGDWYYKIVHDNKSQTFILNQGRILDKKRLEEKMFEISEMQLGQVKVSYCDLIMKKNY